MTVTVLVNAPILRSAAEQMAHQGVCMPLQDSHKQDTLTSTLDTQKASCTCLLSTAQQGCCLQVCSTLHMAKECHKTMFKQAQDERNLLVMSQHSTDRKHQVCTV